MPSPSSRHDAQSQPHIFYVCFLLCGLLLLVFAAQKAFDLTELLLMVKSDAASEPWRIFTAIFVHANMAHLLSNLFALGLFGSILEGRIGSRRVLVLFLISGILINILSPYERSLGASGAIFALIGTLSVLRPWMVIWLNGLPVPMLLAATAWLVQDIAGTFVPSDVANLAHIGGLIIGVGYGLTLRKQFADRKQTSKKTDGHIEREVDAKFEDWEREYMR